jgi:hypothetical protein
VRCPAGKGIRIPVDVATTFPDGERHPISGVPVEGSTDDWENISIGRVHGAGGNTTGDDGKGFILVNALKEGTCKVTMRVGPATTQITIQVDPPPSTLPTTNPG